MSENTELTVRQACGWCRDPYCTGDHSGDSEPGWDTDPAADEADVEVQS